MKLTLAGYRYISSISLQQQYKFVYKSILHNIETTRTIKEVRYQLEYTLQFFIV